MVLEPSRPTPLFGSRADRGAFVCPHDRLRCLASSSAGSRSGASFRVLQTTKIESCALVSERCTRFGTRRHRLLDTAWCSGRGGATVSPPTPSVPSPCPRSDGVMDGEERWRRTRPRSRGSESSPRPNDSPDAAKRPLRHRRARPIGVVSVTSPGLLPTPSAIRNPRLVPRARRGLDESPVTLRVFVWTERRARCTGRVLPMRQAHGSGTRRCSYRFCHRDRSASTRPTLTNLAGPAGTPWQGGPRITPRSGLPRWRCAVPNASGFELRLFRTCAVAGGIAAGPGSECPTP